MSPDLWNLLLPAIGAVVAAVLHKMGIQNPLRPDPVPAAPSVDAPLKDVLEWALGVKAGKSKLDDYDHAVLAQLKPLVDELLALKK